MFLCSNALNGGRLKKSSAREIPYFPRYFFKFMQFNSDRTYFSIAVTFARSLGRGRDLEKNANA